jgi:N-methylhydantoinase A
MLRTDLRRDEVRTVVCRLEQAGRAGVRSAALALRASLLAFLRETRAQVGPSGRAVLSWTAGMRYAGQEHTVEVACRPAEFEPPARAALRTRFDRAHHRLWGFQLADPVELVWLRATGRLTLPHPTEAPWPSGPRARPIALRRVRLGKGPARRVPLYLRSRLPAVCWLEGPAIVVEEADTTVVWPGQRVGADGAGRLWVEG